MKLKKVELQFNKKSFLLYEKTRTQKLKLIN